MYKFAVTFRFYGERLRYTVQVEADSFSEARAKVAKEEGEIIITSTDRVF
jgi:hypothetical protein